MKYEEKLTSAAFDEKARFQAYYDKITCARDTVPVEDLEKDLRDVLTSACRDEYISVQSFIALVVHAYEV